MCSDDPELYVDVFNIVYYYSKDLTLKLMATPDIHREVLGWSVNIIIIYVLLFLPILTCSGCMYSSY